MTIDQQPSATTAQCPRCAHEIRVDQRFNSAEIVCPKCATGFTWTREPQPPVEDMNLCYCSEPAYYAAELRAALRAGDPDRLRSAVEIAAAYLDKLAELGHQSVKGPHPGQEIKLADLDSLPQGAVFADNTGDLWVRETTGWRCYERLGSIDLEEDFQPFIYLAQI